RLRDGQIRAGLAEWSQPPGKPGCVSNSAGMSTRASPVSPRRRLPAPSHPALAQAHEERRAGVQTRIADAITRFAGSMFFVSVHIVWFAIWIASGVEKFPYGLLTMIVSLEAIFLSTFVMISQNRADERRQLLADHQWQTIQM